jgi:hypothetical protein
MKITGHYQVIKYGYQYKASLEFKPIADFYSGSIHYSDDGHMSVDIRFAEKPEDLSEVVAYSGTYIIKGNVIIHTVTTSIRPEYVGQILERNFRFEDDCLITEFENTPEFTKFAAWKRI